MARPTHRKALHLSDRIFSSAAKAYLKNGFKPLPVKNKFPPVSGATGHDGLVDEVSVKGWRATHGDQNIAIRAEGWIGIDVDVYKDKHGDRTLTNYEQRLGKLPKTYSSTARGKASPSRQYFYRVPDNTKLATKIGPDIEIIQFHHRYAMVSPSIHPDTKTLYEWYLPNGKKAPEIPHIDELPDLPDAWLADLQAAPDSVLLDNDVIEWEELLKTFPSSPACHVSETYRDKIETIAKTDHIGHDEALKLSLEGFMLGREGHSGVGEAIKALEGHFTSYLKETRPREAKTELKSVFNSQASIAQRKVVEDQCSCFVTALTVIDPGLKKREKNLPPLLKTNNTLYIENARERFMKDHPVKRYPNSNGVTYIWTGDRWSIEDLATMAYVWLSARLNNDMSASKAAELTTAVLAYAEKITDDDFDTRYISVTNGLLNWETGELIPRTPDIFVVNHLSVAWRPGANLGKFAEWMESTVDPEMIPNVWEIIGYAVSPFKDLKVALAFSGAGGGGKSTLLNIIQGLIGPKNSIAIAPQQIGDRFNRAQLHGKMLNAVGDVGAETMRNVGALKSIIAGDIISAEHKGRDGFSFRPNIFVVASFNTLPATESNDSGYWDRWLVLKFKKRFASDEGVGDNYWRDEMPKDQNILDGVFVEAISALRHLRARGQFDKKAFAEAKNEWRQEVDSVASFAEERLTLDPTGLVKAKTLHELYAKIDIANGGHPRKNQTFYRELLAYLEERYPGKVARERNGPNMLVFTGVKVIHSQDDTTYALVDADTLYGKNGWTRHPHLSIA